MSTAPAPARPTTSTAAQAAPRPFAPPPAALDRAAADREAAARAEQERRDAECLVFFTSLVAAALTMLVVTLTTDITGLSRLLLTAAVTLAAGVITHVLARPVLAED